MGTVVKVDNIGDPSKIVSTSLRITRDTVNLGIARNAVRIIEASDPDVDLPGESP